MVGTSLGELCCLGLRGNVGLGGVIPPRPPPTCTEVEVGSCPENTENSADKSDCDYQFITTNTTGRKAESHQEEEEII